MNTSSPPEHSVPSLHAFLAAADQDEFVAVRPLENGLAVIAVGRTVTGRRVAWIDDTVPGTLPPAIATATAAFLAALEGTYGRRICDVVNKEIALPTKGEPLPSALVHRAVKLARSTQSMFAGDNFMTKLRLSAKAGGPPFRDACEALGLAPDALGAGQRALADLFFAQAFEAMAEGDTVQVEDAVAASLFMDALRRTSSVSEAHAAALADGSDEAPWGGGTA